MKYTLLFIIGLLLLCSSVLSAQSRSNPKDNKTYVFAEFGQGISLINSVKFQGYNPPFLHLYYFGRLSGGIIKNKKKIGLEINGSIRRMDTREDYFYTRQPSMVNFGGFYLVDIVKKEKISLYFGGMAAFTGSSTSIFSFEDNLYHTSRTLGGSLQFRADAHYYFLNNLYAIFSMNTIVLEMGVHEKYSEDNRYVLYNLTKKGFRFSPPIVGFINANVALGVRF